MGTIEETYLRDISFKADFAAAPDGDLQTVTALNNVTQALMNRTITEPGTLVHRPDYGVGLKRFLNAINNYENQNRLANKIKAQWESDERVEEVIGVRVEQDDTFPEKITISVRANLIGYGETEIRIIPFTERVE